MGNSKRAWSAIWPPAAVFAAFVLFWQGAVTLGWVKSWRIPGPLAVVQEAIAIWPRLMGHAGHTMQLTLIGFAGGAAAGFILAALLHLLPGVRRGVYPLFVLSQNVPIVILGPIMTMLFGYGLLPKVLLVMMVCFFPVVVAMLSGLSHADPALRHYMTMIGADKWTLFWRLELPGSMTHLFSGLKIAVSYSVVSAVFAELLAPKNGLGGFMILSSRGFMPERSFAAAVLIIILSLVLFGLIVWAERLAIRWKKQEERRRVDA